MKTLFLTAATVTSIGFAPVASAYYITPPVNDPAIDRIAFSSTGAVNTSITLIATPTCPNGHVVTPSTGCMTFVFNEATNPLFSGSNAFVNPSSTTGAFSQYADNDDYPLMVIKDLTVPFPMPVNITAPAGGGAGTTTNLPLSDWISLGNPDLTGDMTTFTLTSIPDYSFENINGSSRFNLEGLGFWTTYTPDGVKTYDGEISIGNTFNRLSTDDVLALASRPEGFRTSFSGTGTVTERKSTQESAVVFGVLVSAIGMFTCKRNIA